MLRTWTPAPAGAPIKEVDNVRGKWRYKAMIAVAIAALVAGGASALAKSSARHSHPRHARASVGHGHGHGRRGGVLALAAGYLGLTRTQLRHELQIHHTLARIAEATSGRSAAGLIAALASAKASKLQAAVASGKLSQTKDSAEQATLSKRATAAVERPRAVGAAKGELAIAASYLGVSSTQLRHERRAGQSLAELADARAGKSAAGLIDAIVSHKAKLAAAASSSKLSPAGKKMALSSYAVASPSLSSAPRPSTQVSTRRSTPASIRPSRSAGWRRHPRDGAQP